MDSDSENYHSESEFYYPEESEEQNILQENQNIGNTTTDELATFQDFIEAQRPENTKKKTAYDMNIWKRFCSTIGETRELENIPATDLNVLLCRFYINIKKKDGGVYEPSSLTSFERSFQRYLNDKNSSLNLFKDQEFTKSRDVLLAKKRELVEKHAKGNRSQAARCLTEAEEDLLFETKQFGDHDPEVLQRTIWWTLSLHFGFRARDESRKLRWGDVVVDKDPESGGEVLVWRVERGSKTRHGEGAQRAFNPTAQATDTERCPVKLFRKFSSHRPEEMKHPDSPFFLAINHKRKPGSQIWYSKSPLGKNAIGKFLVNAAKAAGLPGNISNHSVRKTCISRLMDAEFPENYVAQLSGHKNLKSLDAYKSASHSHQRQMSLVLSRSSESSTGSTSNSGSTQGAKPALSVQRNETSTSTSTEGFFSGASIGKFEGCTFNFNMPGGEETSWPAKKRKRVAIIDSDSD